ncbi:MAG: hypothetical protein Q4C87_11595 [Actinomycetaceae bacterium]|nr:hypothetical protein [Actinomycetaceae bacterium]
MSTPTSPHTSPDPVTETLDTTKVSEASAVATEERPAASTDSAGTASAAPANGYIPYDERPEAPARGVRVGQLMWAAVVILAGLFLIVLAFAGMLDISLVMIALVAALGIGLIAAALFTGKEPKS